MKRKIFGIAMAGLAAAFVAAVVIILRGGNFGIVSPQGTIAQQQRDLMVVALLLMLIVVVPVFVLLISFAWRYRATNTKAKYTPDWDNNVRLESIWWGLPLAIVVVLAAITYRTSHTLDPYQPIISSKKPIEVQVVALQWKWLFIYPEHNIASVNYLQFPEDTPINLTITADAPMNSLWIPQLGGQIYAMAGMETKLHLMAENQGSYKGLSANISGEGHADMKFIAKATSAAEYDQWVLDTRLGAKQLGLKEYEQLVKPDVPKSPMMYAYADPKLFGTIHMKYMMYHGTDDAKTDKHVDHDEHQGMGH